MPIARRTRGRVGEATRGDHDMVGAIFASCRPDEESLWGVLDAQNGFLEMEGNPLLHRLADQGIRYVIGLMAARENALSALDLQRHAFPLEESHDILRGKVRDCAVKKMGIAHDVRDEFLRCAIIADVAPPLAGDEKLLPGFLVLLEHEDLGPVLGSVDGGGEPRGARSNDDRGKIVHGADTLPWQGVSEKICKIVREMFEFFTEEVAPVCLLAPSPLQ